MSEGKVQTLICNRCKHKSPAILNERAGVDYVRCHGCRTSQRDSLRVHMENEAPEHHAARLKKLSDRYQTDEAFRQKSIDRAMASRQMDYECSVCLKKLKRGSLLAHAKICKGKREPTVLEKILLLG